MTQKELSEKSGVSQVTISFIENSLSTPMDLTKLKLSRALKCFPQSIFSQEQKTNEDKSYQVQIERTDHIQHGLVSLTNNRLRELRMQCLLSQAGLAAIADVTQVTISSLENRKKDRGITPLVAVKISLALNKNPEEVFPGFKVVHPLTKRRAQKGLLQKELAEQAHVSQETISNIERGENKNPSDVIINNLVAVLGCLPKDIRPKSVKK